MFISLFNRVSAVSGPNIRNVTIDFSTSTISFNAYRSSLPYYISIFQYMQITAKVNNVTIGTVLYSPVGWLAPSECTKYRSSIIRLSNDNYDVFGDASQTGGHWSSEDYDDDVSYTIKIGSKLLNALQNNNSTTPQLQLDFRMWWGDRDGNVPEMQK